MSGHFLLEIFPAIRPPITARRFSAYSACGCLWPLPVLLAHAVRHPLRLRSSICFQILYVTYYEREGDGERELWCPDVPLYSREQVYQSKVNGKPSLLYLDALKQPRLQLASISQNNRRQPSFLQAAVYNDQAPMTKIYEDPESCASPAEGSETAMGSSAGARPLCASEFSLSYSNGPQV